MYKHPLSRSGYDCDPLRVSGVERRMEKKKSLPLRALARAEA